ncbi:MAG: HD domain-containing phosphohydrolase [Candidatus Electrothrix sp. YB6]
MTCRQPEEITIASILDTISRLNRLKDVSMTLDAILSEARRLTHADAGSIFLVSKNGLEFRYVQNDTLFGEKGARAAQYRNKRISINENSIVGFSALTREIVAIDDAYEISLDLPYKFNGSFDRKNNYRTTSILAVPLISLDNRALVGVLELINAQDAQRQVTVFSEKSKMLVRIFSNNAAAIIEQSILHRELILRMVKMAELHDPQETGAHAERVSAFSAELYQRWAERRNVPSKEIKRFRDLISQAAPLHDVGKVGIPDSILKKPTSLTPEEYEIMKQHTVQGARLFTNVASELDRITHEIVLHHHEKWDGTGYPGRVVQSGTSFMHWPLAGEDIPLAARIVALADVYDALSYERSYKKSWGYEQIYSQILKDSGSHFDPELVEVFFEITDILRAIQEKFK